jgi:hypothetical protein
LVRSATFAVITLVSVAAGATAQVPASQQALLLLRVLAYDRNLKERAGEGVTITVLSGGQPCDLESALEVAAKQLSVGGLPVTVSTLPWGPGADARLAAQKPAAVYLCPGLSGAVGPIIAISRKQHALSFSGSADDVRAGVGVGMVAKAERASLVVNLVAARAEGASLDSALLRVAEVLDN